MRPLVKKALQKLVEANSTWNAAISPPKKATRETRPKLIEPANIENPSPVGSRWPPISRSSRYHGLCGRFASRFPREPSVVRGPPLYSPFVGRGSPVGDWGAGYAVLVVNGMTKERFPVPALPLGSFVDSVACGFAADATLMRSTGATTGMAAGMLTDSWAQVENVFQRDGISLGGMVSMVTQGAVLTATEAIMALQKQYDLELPDDLDLGYIEVTHAKGRTGAAVDTLNDHSMAAGRFVIDGVSDCLAEAWPTTGLGRLLKLLKE